MMKRVFIFLCITVFLLQTHATAQIEFRTLTLQQALDAGSKEGKNILFMCYEDWCGHCEKMLHEVFTDSALGAYYNKNFICVKQDMSEGEGPQLAKKFYVTSYPTFVFLNGAGETIYQIVGEFKINDFIKVGNDALVTENQIPYLRSLFENNPADSVSCYKYLSSMNRARIPTQKIADTYYNIHKNDFEFSLANWKIFNISVSDMQSESFQFILAHKKEFSDAVTQARVERKLFKLAAYNLQNPVQVNDTTAYFKLRKIASSLQLPLVDSVIFVNDLNIYERNKNYAAYEAVALAGAEKYIWKDVIQLKHIADIFYKNITDINGLQYAAKIAQQAGNLKPEYGTLLLAARLYLKSGDKENAKQLAENAKIIAQQLQINTSEVDLLIGQCN